MHVLMYSACQVVQMGFFGEKAISLLLQACAAHVCRLTWSVLPLPVWLSSASRACKLITPLLY